MTALVRSSLTAASEFPSALASTLSVGRVAALVSLGGTLILELQALAYGYGLRVTSDTPTYIALLREVALHPLRPVSPFLAVPGVETSHATPDMEAVAQIWRWISPSPSLVDPVAAYHVLAWWGIVVTLLVAHALFLWVRGLAGSRAAWVSIPVLLVLFGPANVIWAGDLSFHGFLYAAYFSQTFAVALLLYALHWFPRAESPSARRWITLLVAVLMVVHPFTGVLFAFLITCQAMSWGWRGDPRWSRAPWTLAFAFGLGCAWPAYSLSAAMAVGGLQGWQLVALAVAAPGGAASLGRVVRHLRRREHVLPERSADVLRASVLLPLALCGMTAVFAVSIWLEWLVTRPITDPLHPTNRLAIYWDDRLIRWPLLLGAGIVGVAGLRWLSRSVSRLPAFFFWSCLAVGVAGAAGVALPLWNRILLFCQIPLAAGAAVVLTRARPSVRVVAVTGLLASAAVRLIFLYGAPANVTYYPQAWIPAAYSLGQQIRPGGTGVVAADPYTSYYIPAATGYPVLLISKSHTGSSAELAAAARGYALLHRLYTGERWKQAMREMWRRGVRYVVVDHRVTLSDRTLEQFLVRHGHALAYSRAAPSARALLRAAERDRNPRRRLAAVCGVPARRRQGSLAGGGGVSGSPILSVVVCSHQRRNHLRACLEALSVLEDPVETIVVDSASDPPVSDLVEEYAGRIGLLHYLYEPRPGLSLARNAGLEAASCELVAFVDDDAAPVPDWARLVAAGFTEPDVACVGGSCAPAFEAPRPAWMSERLLALAGVSSFGGVARFVTRTADYPFGANVAFRRADLLEIGGFDPALGRNGGSLLSGEESAVIRELLARGRRVRIEPDAVVAHTVTSQRLSSSYYRRRFYWQGVTQARMGSRFRRSGGLALEVPGYLVSWLRTRDRYYLYRAGPETVGHLAEWTGLAR